MQLGLPGARWIPTDNMHLTLRFIGEVDSADADDIHEALAQIDGVPFHLRLSDLGTFGTRRHARTLWVGVEKCEGLRRLKAQIDAALTIAGQSRDPRKFSPHITLARLRDAEDKRVAAFVAQNAPRVAGAFDVTDFGLYSSHLTSAGAEHTLETSYHLRAENWGNGNVSD